MKHLLLSIILAFSASAAFAVDISKQVKKTRPKCTSEHVPITLKVDKGKVIGFVHKDHVEKLIKAKALQADVADDIWMPAGTE